jgi:hypothetical protein
LGKLKLIQKMKKTYPTSEKAKGGWGYNKHLKKRGKRATNKSTRKIMTVNLRDLSEF